MYKIRTSRSSKMIREVEKPVPKDNEVLIKVYATMLHQATWRIRGFKVPVYFWVMSTNSLGN